MFSQFCFGTSTPLLQETVADLFSKFTSLFGWKTHTKTLAPSVCRWRRWIPSYSSSNCDCYSEIRCHIVSLCRLSSRPERSRAYSSERLWDYWCYQRPSVRRMPFLQIRWDCIGFYFQLRGVSWKDSTVNAGGQPLENPVNLIQEFISVRLYS